MSGESIATLPDPSGFSPNSLTGLIRDGARVRDRKPGAGRIAFTPGILPRCLHKTKSVEELLAWLYLKGEEDRKSIRGIDFPTNNAFW